MAQLTIDVSRDVGQNALKQVFGPGFRDTSRVASSPVQWALMFQLIIKTICLRRWRV